ncbi:hypothetical protein DRW48_08190 [Paracoccus suum]|uniref:Uncharacterized protein n=1 Tax=Paracoccus suum TaxID=2259340 RepID=A0A344PJW6_9RHOB|nr:hypothetical protein [Paracoccus suum]AXC49671.1 hypothetical protein DRW48_08190 [Paracoccus suum]
MLVVASVIFLASSIGFAVAPALSFQRFSVMLPDLLGEAAGPAPGMARPTGIALKILLAGVWLAVGLHALRCLLAEISRRTGPRTHAMPLRENRLSVHLPFVIALLAGAAWPWVAEQEGRIAGLILSGVMVAASLWHSLSRRHSAHHVTLRGGADVFAGWAMVGLYAGFAAILVSDLGMSAGLAAIVSVLLMMASAAEVQLRLGGSVGFSFAVIWALIGTAANAMQTELTVATAAIIAIAALVAVLVRVMS